MRNRVPQFDMPSNVFIIALLIALIFVFVVDFFDNRSNYLEANAASGYEGRSGAIYPIARELIISADILFVISQKRWSMLSIIAFVLICLTMLPLVLEGSRILLLMPIIVIAFKYIKNVEVNLSMIFFALAGMIFCIYIIAPIVIVLGKNRQQGVIELSILIDPRNLQNAQDALFIELFAKLDSFTQGAVLTNQSTSVSGMGVAGLAPFYGLLFVFVPRFLWPERPVAWKYRWHYIWASVESSSKYIEHGIRLHECWGCHRCTSVYGNLAKQAFLSSYFLVFYFYSLSMRCLTELLFKQGQ